MKNLNVQKRRKSQKGFTLVELAVVMIIVGLLIGGILKGQELIANAQVASLISQVRSVDAGISTFRDSYRSFPGDMRNAQARLPACTDANVCFNGGGDGRVNEGVDGTGAAAAASNNTNAEAGNFFIHLARADLITGVDPTSTATNSFDAQYPSTALGGGFMIGHTAEAIAANIGGSTNLLGGHYLVWASEADGGIADDDGPVNASQAARIDRKMDDGSPVNGSVRATAGDCIVDGTLVSPAVPDIYNEANAAEGCNLVFRVQS